MVLLIDFAHSWAGSWLSQAEEGSRCHAFGLLFVSFMLYAMTLTLSILMFVFYTKSSDGNSCTLNKFFIGLDMALVLLVTFVSVLPSVRAGMPNSGVLQSGILSFYMTYLTWTAVSNTNGQCQPTSTAGNSTATTVVGTLLMFVAICYSSLRTTSASQLGKLGLSTNADGMAKLLESEKDDLDDDNDDGRGGQKVVDSELEGVSYSWSFFHVVFAVASLYLTMILTDYATIKLVSRFCFFLVDCVDANT